MWHILFIKSAVWKEWWRDCESETKVMDGQRQSNCKVNRSFSRDYINTLVGNVKGMCTHENLNRFALWSSKFLCSSHSMNHHRAGTSNITAVHSNATRGSKRRSSWRKQSESISTEGVRWERTEECRCRQSSIAGPLVLQGKRENVWAKLESLFIFHVAEGDFLALPHSDALSLH